MRIKRRKKKKSYTVDNQKKLAIYRNKMLKIWKIFLKNVLVIQK